MIRKSLLLTVLFAASLSHTFAASLSHAQVQKSSIDEKEKQADLDRQKELHYRNLYLFILPSEKKYQLELDLSDTQIEGIHSAHDKFMKDFETIGAFRGKLYSKLQQGLLEKETYEKAISENKAAETRLKEQYQTHANKILLPHQRQMISKRARRVRMTQMKDEFEVPFIIAREQGLAPGEVRRIARAVNEARKEHYAKLKKIREKYEKSVLAEMDPELRRRFVKLYGEFYDYGSERAIELTKGENGHD